MLCLRYPCSPKSIKQDREVLASLSKEGQNHLDLVQSAASKKRAFSKIQEPKRTHKAKKSPSPPAEPRNPETPKVHFKVRKMPFSTPRKKGPKSQLKCPKSPFFGELKCPKTGFLDILIDFWGPFSGGSKKAFFGL